MLRRLMPYILVILMVMADTTVVPVFLTSVYVLPLALLFVMCTGMLLGRMHGVLCGLLGGLLVDILTGYPLGYMMFSYIACGYVTGLMGCDTDEMRAQEDYSRTKALFRRAFAVALMLTAFETVTLVYQYFNTAHMEWAYAAAALRRIAIGTAATSLLYYPLSLILVSRTKTRVRLDDRREVKNL